MVHAVVVMIVVMFRPGATKNMKTKKIISNRTFGDNVEQIRQSLAHLAQGQSAEAENLLNQRPESRPS
jgi:hypothetical protein